MSFMHLQPKWSTVKGKGISRGKCISRGIGNVAQATVYPNSLQSMARGNGEGGIGISRGRGNVAQTLVARGRDKEDQLWTTFPHGLNIEEIIAKASAFCNLNSIIGRSGLEFQGLKLCNWNSNVYMDLHFVNCMCGQE
ncbi:12-oxophytodienoate reductase 2 [Prunus dulcis]|uniref:12-oxophytodienoate reductase 2 n=1 Tax=Prunus dulcis TaxID=3755 RepID=A0A4Y1QV33_PRUDU|nr:12-oxophytodienoate reductase 2 [Prunus dulcis]